MVLFFFSLQKYRHLSLVGNYLDIFIIMIFLVLLLFMRILYVWFAFTNYIQAKSIMCFGLIYFFYRLLGVYLPISPTLGPMLLRINRMVSYAEFIYLFQGSMLENYSDFIFFKGQYMIAMLILSISGFNA